MAFPSSPTTNQTAVEGGRTYQWDGKVWNLVANISGHATNHGAAGSDPVTIQTSQISDLAAGANAAAKLYLWANFR